MQLLPFYVQIFMTLPAEERPVMQVGAASSVSREVPLVTLAAQVRRNLVL